MFYHINGVVTDIEPNLVVLECGGVGYALNASLNTISSVKTGERVISTALPARAKSTALSCYSPSPALGRRQHCPSFRPIPRTG